MNPLEESFFVIISKMRMASGIVICLTWFPWSPILCSVFHYLGIKVVFRPKELS